MKLKNLFREKHFWNPKPELLLHSSYSKPPFETTEKAEKNSFFKLKVRFLVPAHWMQRDGKILEQIFLSVFATGKMI